MPYKNGEHPIPKWIITVALISLLFFVFALLPGIHGHIDDRGYWTSWAGYIKQNGLRNAYGSGTDYPPLYQYILWGYAKLCGTAEDINRNIARLRLITLFFDLAGIWLVARWIGRQHWWQALALFSVLNVAFSYNTIIWGQVDGMLATLVFASLYCVWSGKMLRSAALVALGVTFKLQAVVFLPLWALLMIDSAAVGKHWRTLVASLFVLVAVAGIVCSPFLFTAEGRSGMHNAFFGSVGRHPYASMIAANMWYWIIDTNPRWTLDTEIWFWGLSYKKAGLLLFFALSFIALWPILRHVAANLFSSNKKEPISREKLWLAGSLISLLFFFCNTEMHSRYAHPILLLLTAYSFYTRDFFPYVLACLALFLNLEKANEWMLSFYDRLVFDGRFIAALWALLIIYLFARLYGWRAKRLPVLPAEKSMQAAEVRH